MFRPGEKYIYATRDHIEKAELAGGVDDPPGSDGIVISYKGKDIISVEAGTNTYMWSSGGCQLHHRLRDMLNEIDRRLSTGTGVDSLAGI